jgi:hypothetical protein
LTANDFPPIFDPLTAKPMALKTRISRQLGFVFLGELNEEPHALLPPSLGAIGFV